jgi:dipeptidyl-peptidase-4
MMCLAGAHATELPVERLFDAPDLQGPSLRQMRFSPDGKLVSYLRGRDDAPAVFDLWAYDVAQKEHRLLVDSHVLAPGEARLSAEEEARRERQRIAALRGIVDYQWAPDSKGLLVPLAGDLFYYDLAKPRAEAVRRLTQTDAFETDPKFSPRGRYVSFIRNQDLHAVELASGAERRLTTGGGGLVSHGMAEFIAQEEMSRDTGYWWSPDEKHLAYARVDESPVDEVERFEIDADGVRVLRQRYPATGRPNAEVRLAILALDSGKVAWCDLGRKEHYLARVEWYPEGDRLLVQRQARDQKRLDVLSYPVTGGAARQLFSERSDTWVELNDDLYFLPERREMLWASQRSGHNHLYLYDYGGVLKGPVTAGDWDVSGEWNAPSVRGIDERRGKVYFMATIKTPLERHLYVADLDDGPARKPVALTQGEGWNNVTMSGDARRFLAGFSAPAQPPQVSLHDASGERLAWLVENRLDAEHPYAPYLDRHVLPEFGTIPAADGTPLYYQLYKPAGFEPGKRYPAVLMVYGGPTVQTVQRRWGERRGNQTAQLFTQRGYVVFAIDNRGSGGRGKRFTEAVYRRLGGVEVQDQLKGIAWLKSQPFVDPARVGAYGWSYGGYMTLMLLGQSPGTFKAAVAGAPVTDYRLYDTHYTERYLGTPAENPEGYRLSNVLTYAGAIRDRLLIVHGMADDNVLFTHTTLLIPALVASGQPFELVPYPGSKHAALSFRDTGIHGWKTILDFFDRNL